MPVRAGVLLLVACGTAAGREDGTSAPATAVSTNTALAAHAARLREKAPAGFTVLVQSPFVVAGDESPQEVERCARMTVKWAVDALKRDFFRKDPDEIIDIWLFRDTESYTNHAWQIFHDKPDTPFGYYSAQDHALVMNIRTGGGTLVHEIVHPFMRANFPACPPWFNEGLASLFEQSGEKDGHIRGLPNWRLPDLQQAIRQNRVGGFEQLMAMDEDAFYGRKSGAPYNSQYAQSRYLCYYLQEQGLLVKFYREFTANAKEDPTGFKTLQKVLGSTDMAGFLKRWEQFVLGLRFER